MKILVSNVGSTSLKFKLFEMPGEQVYCQAKVERVGSRTDAIFSYQNTSTGWQTAGEGLSIPTYADGIRLFLEHMTHPDHGVVASVDEVDSVGFKTVLSKDYYGVHELTEPVLEGMRQCLFVAPVHNSAYLEAIEQFKAILPDVRMVGVFETAFHTTIPLHRRLYGVPYEWYEKYGLMKMGYHGASHAYASQQAAQYGPADRVISCHLGGSCSICAIQEGKSVDTSFGYSLQSGVMHANRCGDADPYTALFLMDQGLTREQVLDGLTKHGGLLGLSGVSNDMRQLQQAAQQGNDRARLAIDAFAYDVVRYIGAFYAELGGLDQLVFTGGIGENAADFRAQVCARLAHMGILLDEERNRTLRSGVISQEGSPVLITVIPANEELGVARQTYRCITN